MIEFRIDTMELTQRHKDLAATIEIDTGGESFIVPTGRFHCSYTAELFNDSDDAIKIYFAGQFPDRVRTLVTEANPCRTLEYQWSIFPNLNNPYQVMHCVAMLKDTDDNMPEFYTVTESTL